MMTKVDLLKALSAVRPSSTFLVINGYRNKSGEVANHCIAFHISYSECLYRSFEMVRDYPCSNELEVQAKNELISSYLSRIKNLVKPVAAKDDGFIRFKDPVTDRIINGVKLHEKSNKIHIFGLKVWKKVIVPGFYKPVNSLPLTVAKRKIESLVPVSRFRAFIIEHDTFDYIAVDRQEIMPPLDEIIRIDNLDTLGWV